MSAPPQAPGAPITDRRQPYVRWTAVLAGALTALGTWLLLQLLFTGGALSAIDPDEVDRLRGYSIGASIGSVLAPLLAMFVGGLVAGRLAAYYDRRVSGFHGALVWTIASVLGLAFIGSFLDHNRDAIDAHANMAAPAPGATELVDDTVADLAAIDAAASAVTDAAGPASSIEADFAFHRAIAAASGNRYLRASLEQLGARSIVVPHARVASASNDGVDAAAALAEHRAIVDAIRSGDALGASAAMRAHLAASASRRRA